MAEINLSLFNLLSILSLFSAWIFVFQMHFLKEKTKANQFFSVYLIAIAAIVFFFLIAELGFNRAALFFVPFFITAALSIGPLLWLYVNEAVGGEKIKILKHLLVPLIFGLLVLILVLLVLVLIDSRFGALLDTLLTVVTLFATTFVFLTQNGYYIRQSLKLYNKHQKNVGNVFSYTDRVNLSWLKLLVYGNVAFIFSIVCSTLLDDVWSDAVLHLVLFIYIIFSGFNALKFEPVFSLNHDERENEKENNVEEIDLKNDFFIELKRLLEIAMVKDKVYLNDALTIHSLAAQLKTNRKYLSQLINTEFKKSFVVFINEYRVAEAKALLKSEENKHFTIEAIGYKSGFKSKSAFNSAFKKITGETPSSFLKEGK